MRLNGVGLFGLLLTSTIAACSGSSNTGSSGGWQVSGAHIHIVGIRPPCPTPAPVLDTFSSTPSPDPNCTPAESAQPSASPAAAPVTQWRRMHTENYRSATQQAWHPIYTTYTAPPGTGIYQPMEHATEQPMPTPFTTPTPVKTPTPSPLPTDKPFPTNPPSNGLSSPANSLWTPYPSETATP